MGMLYPVACDGALRMLQRGTGHALHAFHIQLWVFPPFSRSLVRVSHRAQAAQLHVRAPGGFEGTRLRAEVHNGAGSQRQGV